MLIVDSQVHIWGKNLPTNPAHRQITAYSAEDLLKEMDEAGKSTTPSVPSECSGAPASRACPAPGGNA